MKKQMTILGLLAILMASLMGIEAFATAASGTIKYKEHNIYVHGYVNYMNTNIFPLPDKVWASVNMYGKDTWYLTNKVEGAKHVCETNKGQTVLKGVLTELNKDDKVSGKCIYKAGSKSATMTITILADKNNSISFTSTD